MAHDPISSDTQRDQIGTTFSHIQSILICYKWILSKMNYHKALDIGCGEGYGVKILKEAGAFVVAVDLHLPALEIIKYQGIYCLCTDAFEMGVKGCSCDLIVGSHIIEHFDDCERERFLFEVTRAVKPEGTVVIATPNPERGFHYQHTGVHKILYDRDHLYDFLARYFGKVEFYGVYPRVAYRTIKGILRSSKQFLKNTGLLSFRRLQNSIAKTSIATTALNFSVEKYKHGAQHLIAVCKEPKGRTPKTAQYGVDHIDNFSEI